MERFNDRQDDQDDQDKVQPTGHQIPVLAMPGLQCPA